MSSGFVLTAHCYGNQYGARIKERNHMDRVKNYITLKKMCAFHVSLFDLPEGMAEVSTCS